LRQVSQENAVWAADLIGYTEDIEQRQSISYEMNDQRDEVFFASQCHQNYVVPFTQLLTLDNQVVIVRPLHLDPVQLFFDILFLDRSKNRLHRMTWKACEANLLLYFLASPENPPQ